MKHIVFALMIAFGMASCSEGNFAGDSGKTFKKAAEGKCKPTPSNPCATSSNPSTGAPNDSNNPLSSDNGGNAVLNRTFASFYFSGNGPGSCSEDNVGCGTGAPRCEAGSVDAVANGIVGDCPETSFRGPSCFGNRRICKSIGKLPGDRLAIDFHFFVNQACPAGWEGAGPIPGQNHHKIGYRLDSWGFYTLCRQTIPISQVVPKLTKVVTDIRLDGAGSRRPSGLPCPAGYQEAGVLTDCVNAAGITPPGSPSCSGQVRICKKFETIP